MELSFGNSRMVICGPVYSGMDNENSLCVLFDTEKCDILITGDLDGFGERMLLRTANIPDVDVLIAGHHGSKNSTTQPLLEVTRPQVVVISAGENNPYGHPAQELLDRLEEYGCIVFRTDRDGTITIRR
jgi:competence protein ComEC